MYTERNFGDKAEILHSMKANFPSTNSTDGKFELRVLLLQMSNLMIRNTREVFPTDSIPNEYMPIHRPARQYISYPLLIIILFALLQLNARLISQFGSCRKNIPPIEVPPGAVDRVCMENMFEQQLS